MKQAKHLFSIFLTFSFIIIVSVEAADEDYLEVQTELGDKYRLSKVQWPVVFRCSKYGGSGAGEFMYSIRKNVGNQTGKNNALLIFEDYFAYSGELSRDGINWSFDWRDKKTNKTFSIVIKQGGEMFYYDWSLADKNGRLSVNRSGTCK
ncbi:MAG: hypothetical protein IIB64_10280 [Proteobacteria bacterium]|nr:hypothetical protein [Pseudomonadota bacterium]